MKICRSHLGTQCAAAGECCNTCDSMEMDQIVLRMVRMTIISIPPTPLKTNMYTQNDGLEKVAPFKYGPFWYLC